MKEETPKNKLEKQSKNKPQTTEKTIASSLFKKK